MKRPELLSRLRDTKLWDVIIIGGGATGLGAAVDAVSRGYQTLLLEAYDYAKGTSSRATKLVHGGVRYLAQGNIGLVRDALRERGLMRQNAPHLVSNLGFVIPAYNLIDLPFYGVGLRFMIYWQVLLILKPVVGYLKRRPSSIFPRCYLKGLRGVCFITTVNLMMHAWLLP